MAPGPGEPRSARRTHAADAPRETLERLCVLQIPNSVNQTLLTLKHVIMFSYALSLSVNNEIPPLGMFRTHWICNVGRMTGLLATSECGQGA